MRRLLDALGKAFDLRDAMLVVGLGLVAAGLREIYEPAAFAVPGAVLTGVAIFGVRR